MEKLFKTLLFATACALFFTGCAATTPSLNAESYRKETIPHRHTYFTQILTGKDEKGFTVSGQLHMKRGRVFNIPDYVEVALLDKDGDILKTQKVAYSPPLSTRRKHHTGAGFSANFVETPPPGSIIRLSNVN